MFCVDYWNNLTKFRSKSKSTISPYECVQVIIPDKVGVVWVAYDVTDDVTEKAVSVLVVEALVGTAETEVATMLGVLQTLVSIGIFVYEINGMVKDPPIFTSTCMHKKCEKF